MKKHARHPEEATRIEAYLLSEHAGHPQGLEAVFWAAAEAIVRRRGAMLSNRRAEKTASNAKSATIKKTTAKPAIMKAAAEKQSLKEKAVPRKNGPAPRTKVAAKPENTVKAV